MRRVIRDARAKDPLITVGRIQRLLEKRFQRGFSYEYIARVAEKVDGMRVLQLTERRMELTAWRL